MPCFYHNELNNAQFSLQRLLSVITCICTILVAGRYYFGLFERVGPPGPSTGIWWLVGHYLIWAIFLFNNCAFFEKFKILNPLDYQITCGTCKECKKDDRHLFRFLTKSTHKNFFISQIRIMILTLMAALMFGSMPPILISLFVSFAYFKWLVGLN